jgi:hypothetical protein
MRSLQSYRAYWALCHRDPASMTKRMGRLSPAWQQKLKTVTGNAKMASKTTSLLMVGLWHRVNTLEITLSATTNSIDNKQKCREITHWDVWYTAGGTICGSIFGYASISIPSCMPPSGARLGSMKLWLHFVQTKNRIIRVSFRLDWSW